MKPRFTFSGLTPVFALLASPLSAQSSNPPPTVAPVGGTMLGDPVHLVWLAVFVGFATAALVEVAKDLLGWRARFHCWFVRDWIERRAGHVGVSVKAAMTSNRDKDVHSPARGAINQLETLAGDDSKADERASSRDLPIYALPAENLCGQLVAAAEVAVGAPETFPDVFAVLAGVGAAVSAGDIEDYVKLAHQRRNRIYKQLSEEQERQDAERYGDLRGRFMVQAQRALDNLQVALAREWHRRLVLACVGTAVIASLTVVGFYASSETSRLSEFLFAVAIVSVWGAMFAPFAHDLMRAVRSFRRS